MAVHQQNGKESARGKGHLLRCALIGAVMVVLFLAANATTWRSHIPNQAAGETATRGTAPAVNGPPKAEFLPPGFLVDTLDGGTLSLQDLRGRYVLLDFWAVWCKICEAQLPHLKKVWEEFGSRGDFVQLGLCFGDNPDTISRFVAEHQEPWLQGVLVEGFSDPVARHYGVNSLPHIVLIGPDGRVVADNLLDGQIESAVRAALEPPAHP